MNKNNFIGSFIGINKIKNTYSIERTTSLGQDVIGVEFEDGGKKEYPREILESIISEEQNGDLVVLRQKMVEPLAKKIILLLLNSEIPLEDISWLLNTRIPMSIENSVAEAYKKFWNKERWELTLADIDNYLKDGSNSPKQSSDGTSPKRSGTNKKTKKAV